MDGTEGSHQSIQKLHVSQLYHPSNPAASNAISVPTALNAYRIGCLAMQHLWVL